MKHLVIKITVPEYLADWCRHEWPSAEPLEPGAVRFPRCSPENELLELYIRRVPKDTVLPEENGNLTIEVPFFKNKQPGQWREVTERTRKMLAHSLQVRFKVKLWKDLYKIERLNAPITDVIYEWMDQNGITENDKNWETIRQIFYRQRNRFSRKTGAEEDENEENDVI